MSSIDGIGKAEDPIENPKYAEGNGTGTEFTTDTPEDSTPVDIPDAPENDSGEPGKFTKAVATIGVGMSLWGMQGAITRPIDLDVPPVRDTPPVTAFDPDAPDDWCSLGEGFSKLAGGDEIEIVSLEGPVKIEGMPPDDDDKKRTANNKIETE